MALPFAGPRPPAPAEAGLLLASALAVAALVALPPARRGLRVAAVATLALGVPLALLALVAQRDARTPVGEAAATPPSGDPPHVVLLVVDTWRPDHTALGDYGRPTSPALAELAQERATVFRRAYSPAASTAPSVKGLFTSRSPANWGLAEAKEPPPLSADTLAEAFRATGYATAGFSSNSLIRGEGFEQGFGTFLSFGGYSFFRSAPLLYDMLLDRRYWTALRRMESWRLHKASGDAVLDAAGRWLDERPRERPFFLYLHILEPHWPFHDYGHGLPGPVAEETPLSHVDVLRLPKGRPANRRLRSNPRVRDLVRRYDESVREADRILAGLLAALRARSLEERTLLVVTGDHGEEFFEHGGFGHGHDVFEEQIHVPLVLRWPRDERYAGMPRESDVPVSLLDLLPTLHDLLGLAGAPRAPAGQSLLPLLEGRPFERRRPVLAEAYPPGRWRIAYAEGSRRVRMDLGPGHGPWTTERLAVYDLEESPDQRALVGPSRAVRRLAARARRAVQLRWRAARRAGGGHASGLAQERAEEGRARTEDRALEQLRALGYVE